MGGFGSAAAKEVAAAADATGAVQGAKSISPVVTAEGKIGDAAFTDVNQTARPIAQANPDEPTLIADRVATKIEATGKPLPNGNMADAHAEIGVIQQAYNAGKTQGADMAMSVAGKDVCGFCKGDIAAAAEKAGLKSLTVQAMDDVTGLPKKYNWVPGMRSIKEVP
jgi:filamentous hemagglutinin